MRHVARKRQHLAGGKIEPVAGNENRPLAGQASEELVRAGQVRRAAHRRAGRVIEIRWAGKPSLAVRDRQRFTAIVFGAGSYRARTEDRPSPPVLAAGDGANTRLRVVDAILSGTHEPGTSHVDLLHAFADTAVLRRADAEMNSAGYHTHEFGDSVLIERASRRYSRATGQPVAAAIFPEMQGLVERAAPRILRGFAPAPTYVVQESHRLSPACRLVRVRP